MWPFKRREKPKPEIVWRNYDVYAADDGAGSGASVGMPCTMTEAMAITRFLSDVNKGAKNRIYYQGGA